MHRILFRYIIRFPKKNKLVSIKSKEFVTCYFKEKHQKFIKNAKFQEMTIICKTILTLVSLKTNIIIAFPLECKETLPKTISSGKIKELFANMVNCCN